jgi:pimeloyl-ACP methyl ester carboxylesterase
LAATVVVAQAAPVSESLVVVSAGESLRVTEAGSGEPVVLIPGLFGSAFGFRQVLSLLAEAGYRAIVVEPLGIGGSSKPKDADYSLTAQADRLARVFASLNLPPAVVAAHAVGASIALRLAYRHPERVRVIVSLDGGPAENAATPGLKRAMFFAPLIRLFGGVKRIRGTVRNTLVGRSADASWVTEAVVDGYMEAAARDLEGTLTAYQGMSKSREPESLAAHLGDVRCPVFLVRGSVPHEGGPSPEEVAVLRRRVPCFATFDLPGLGHFIFEERPAAFVSAVQRAVDSGRTETCP